MEVEELKLIIAYSPQEGVPWIDWPEPLVISMEKLEYLRTQIPNSKYIVLANVEVHALQFKDGTEWDTINGMRVHNFGIGNMQKSLIKNEQKFNARTGITYETTCACGSMFITCNGNPLSEIFIRIGKAGGCASALNESVGKLISHYLQEGGDINIILKSLAGVSCHSANGSVLSCISAATEIIKEHLNQTKGE